MPAIGLFETDDGLEQRGLADAVRTDDADDPVARQAERQVVDQHAVAETLAQVRHLDHDTAQARARRDLDLLEVELARALGLVGHLLVALQTRLGLRLPGLGVGPHPGELVLQAPLQLLVLLALDRQALGLLLQVRGVVALVGVRPATVQFEDPLRHVVQEVPVVGDREDGAGVAGEELLQPLHALGVEVVGRLVQQQQVGLAQQQLAQRDPAALPSGERAHLGVRRRAPQRVHRLFELRVEVPGVGMVQLLWS